MIILLLLVRVVVFALGAYVVFRACLSALRTFVLPRSALVLPGRPHFPVRSAIIIFLPTIY